MRRWRHLDRMIQKRLSEAEASGDPDRIREEQKRANQAYAGGTGETIGATVGTFILPGIGTVVGGVIGYFVGREVGKEINKD